MHVAFERGFPPSDFFAKAWASEPLTNALGKVNVPLALPNADLNVSLIAKNEKGNVIGQCSANRVAKYWNHIENIDSTNQNRSTQIFIEIHKKAVLVEKEYLKRLQEPVERAFHSAGIAVIPEYRGKNMGLTMREKQIDLCKSHKGALLFCETTNRFSAKTVKEFGFTKLAEFPYSQLANELKHDSLRKIDDSFSVWCLTLSKPNLRTIALFQRRVRLMLGCALILIIAYVFIKTFRNLRDVG